MVGCSVLRDRGGLTTRSWCRVGRHKSAREGTKEGKTSSIVHIRRGDEFLWRRLLAAENERTNERTARRTPHT